MTSLESFLLNFFFRRPLFLSSFIPSAPLYKIAQTEETLLTGSDKLSKSTQLFNGQKQTEEEGAQTHTHYTK
jgi:hypothetical protein